MSWLNAIKSLGLILVALFFAIPAKAQFEVSPDHFDSPANSETQSKPKARSKAVAHPNASSAVAGATVSSAAVHSRKTAAHSTHATGAPKPETTKAQTSARAITTGQPKPANKVADGNHLLTRRE